MTAAHRSRSSRTLVSGALAGTVTSIGFAALHHLLISDIWFSVVPMMAAGALCGLCLAWSYRLLFEAPTPASWLLYNLEFVGLILLMGMVSLLVYEPVYTFAGLSAGTENAEALLQQSLLQSAAFGLLAGIVISLIRGHTVAKATAIITTCLAVLVLLGHSAAMLGLVHMTQEAVPMLAEFYGLTVAIMAGFVGSFLLLERRGLFAPARLVPATEGEQVEVPAG